MFATTTTATFTNSSDANFRIWGSAFADKLGEAGLVQTADTGQIDWVTVTAPGVINTFQGYEIWRFNDALQATAPVFIKFEYGSATGSVNNPAVRFQLGSGSDGAGALTGSLSTVTTAMATALAVTTTHYWSGSTGRFLALMGGGGTGSGVNTPLIFSLERSKAASGADTVEAVLVIYKDAVTGAAAGSYAQYAWDTNTGMKTVIEGSLGLSVLLPSVGTGVTGTQVATYPVFHTKGVFMNPGMNIQVYFHDDIVALGAVSIPMYGSNRTYLPVGTSVASGIVLRSANANSFLIRYE